MKQETSVNLIRLLQSCCILAVTPMLANELCCFGVVTIVRVLLKLCCFHTVTPIIVQMVIQNQFSCSLCIVEVILFSVSYSTLIMSSIVGLVITSYAFEW